MVAAFAPAIDLDSSATSIWHNTGSLTPDFRSPTIDADVYPQFTYNGTIKVYLQGAYEKTSTIPEDPDTSNPTAWIKVYDSTTGGLVTGSPWNGLDDRKWWRFKIEFHVDSNHSFSNPMPTVRSMTIDIAQ